MTLLILGGGGGGGGEIEWFNYSVIQYKNQFHRSKMIKVL